MKLSLSKEKKNSHPQLVRCTHQTDVIRVDRLKGRETRVKQKTHHDDVRLPAPEVIPQRENKKHKRKTRKVRDFFAFSSNRSARRYELASVSVIGWQTIWGRLTTISQLVTAPDTKTGRSPFISTIYYITTQ